MIINASPLIIFGRLNRIDVLKQVCPGLKIAKSVYEEVVLRGIEKNAKDALIIKGYIDDKAIAVLDLRDKFSNIANKIKSIYDIDIGEAETIALAMQLNETEAVIDEIAAREAAKAFGIKPIGSLRILLLAYKKSLVSKAEIKNMVSDMENSKYRFSPAVLMEFWNLLDKIG